MKEGPVSETVKEPAFYDYRDVALVFRACAEYLLAHSDLLDTKGVFRVPGNKNESRKLCASIVTTGEFLSKDVNVITSAMKYILAYAIDNDLFGISKERSQDFLNVINQTDPNEYYNFIKDLMDGSTREMYLGEVLYIMHYLACNAAKHSEKSAMDATNLAQFICQNMIELLKLPVEHRLVYARRESPLTAFIAGALQSTNFSESFRQNSDFYSDEIKKKKLKMLAPLEAQLGEKLEKTGEAMKHTSLFLKGVLEKLERLSKEIEVLQDEIKSPKLSESELKQKKKKIAAIQDEIAVTKEWLDDLYFREKTSVQQTEHCDKMLRPLAASCEALRQSCDSLLRSSLEISPPSLSSSDFASRSVSSSSYVGFKKEKEEERLKKEGRSSKHGKEEIEEELPQTPLKRGRKESGDKKP